MDLKPPTLPSSLHPLAEEGKILHVWYDFFFRLRQFLVSRAGSVTVAGAAITASTLPLGWSVARTGVGVYVVTHGLGSLAYAVSVAPTAVLVQGVATATNTFTVSFQTGAGAATDSSFTFNLSPL